MAGEWRESTWGEEVSLEYGKALRGYSTEQGAYRVFGSNGPIGWTSEPLAPGPGVILGRKGAYRGVEFSRTPFWVIDTAYYIVPKTELDLRWVYYAIKHHKLGEIDDGSPIPSTTRAAVYVKDVQVPPLKEQEAISCILGALDDKIELNRRMNRTLEDTARAIFKSWFVDFLPVRAKQRARTQTGDPVRLPAEASAQAGGLKPEIAALFPDSFEDSELGEVPKRWGIRPIGDIVQVLGGGTPSTKEPVYWEGGIHPFCTPKDMAPLTDSVLLQTERHLTDKGLAKVSSGQLPLGTVLLSSRAPIGYLAVAETPVSINQGIIAMVCDGELPNLYVLYWTKANMDQILANANGSTFMEISKRNFRPITAIIPPPQVLRCFMQVVGPTYQRVVLTLKQIQHLADLRDSLLPKLVSGEIRVKDAERIAGRLL